MSVREAMTQQVANAVGEALRQLGTGYEFKIELAL
jgi:hypothetical protein